jgi:hypothetical protein
MLRSEELGTVVSNYRRKDQCILTKREHELMTFDEIVNQASEKRGMGFEQLLARMDHSMSEVKQATAAYRLAYRLFRELLKGDRYADCLRSPRSYYDALYRMRFSESWIRQLLEQIALDRAEIESCVGFELAAAGVTPPPDSTIPA